MKVVTRCISIFTSNAWAAGIIADKIVQTEQVCSILTSYVSINETTLPAKWRDVNNQANSDNFGTNKKVEIKLEVKRCVIAEGKQIQKQSGLVNNTRNKAKSSQQMGKISTVYT